MTLYVLVRYAHFLGIFVLAASLAAEWLLLKPQHTRAELRRLSIIDGVYGLSSIVVVAAGFTLWLWVGKPADFYDGNPVFYTKLGLVVAMGLLSAYPTVFFIRESRRGGPEEEVEVPKAVFLMLYAELALLAVIPLTAVLMAQGIGK